VALQTNRFRARVSRERVDAHKLAHEFVGTVVTLGETQGRTPMADSVRNLMASERRQRIALFMASRGAVRVGELTELFGVSSATIRADLSLMARQGQLRRDHGGAASLGRLALGSAHDQRATLNAEEKSRIGRMAASLVRPHDKLILDAGTTVMAMVRNLSVSPLVVVTAALNIATQVGGLPDVRVLVAGGWLNTETISNEGPKAEHDMSDVFVEKTFLATHAIDANIGLTDASLEIARVKQAMTRAARQVILLADSSKWGRIAFAKVVPWSSVHTFITDTALPVEARATLERLGIELIIV